MSTELDIDDAVGQVAGTLAADELAGLRARAAELEAMLEQREADIGQACKAACDRGRACERAEVENARLQRDAARLDWLSEPDNAIGNVQLPTQCVESNPDSLRGAIDMAMAMPEKGKHT